MGISWGPVAMRPSRYGFVDGGYLRSKFYESLLPVFGEVPDVDFKTLRDQIAADRMFFYDCENDEAEASTEYQVWTRNQLQLVRGADAYRLRLGTLTRSGKKKPASQKEVDVLLSVELLSNAFMRNMQEAVLVTGDLDFRPAIEEIVRHGTRVHLFYDESGASKDLLDVVDFRRPMSFATYYGWTSSEFQASHPIPRKMAVYKNSNGVRLGTERRLGFINGKLVKLVDWADNLSQFLLLVPDEGGDPNVLYTAYAFPKSAEDFVLGKYVPRLLGELHWSTQFD